MKQNETTRGRLNLIIMTALLAALTTALTFVHIPLPIVDPEGYIHFGDAVVYLAGCLLPLPYSLAAAAIGGGMADLLSGYAIWTPATVIIKAAIAALFCMKREKVLTRRNALMTIPAAVISLAGYFFGKLILFPGTDWRAILVTSLGGNLVQAVGSTILFFAMATAIDRLKLKRMLPF